MIAFTKQILNFFHYHSKNLQYDLTMLPSNGTAINVGDVLLFKYHGDKRLGHKGYRMVLVVEPVTIEPKTGNELVSAVRVPLDSRFTSDQLSNLYTLRRQLLPQDSYRTYILSKMENIRRIEQQATPGGQST